MCLDFDIDLCCVGMAQVLMYILVFSVFFNITSTLLYRLIRNRWKWGIGNGTSCSRLKQFRNYEIILSFLYVLDGYFFSPCRLRRISQVKAMPEGPELHLSSRFVKKVGDALQFTGKILERLPSNRSPRLDEINSRLSATGCYTVTSWSRGKELMVAIRPLDLPDSKKYRPEEWSIRFNFGMTGCFKFTRADELPKHAKVW